MRSRVAVLVLLSLLVVARRAEADAYEFPERTYKAGPDIGLGFQMFRPNLSGVVFDGGGTRAGTSVSVPFHHAGSEIGLRTPTLIGGELRMGVQLPYLRIGAQGFIGAHPGSAEAASNHDAAALADPTGLITTGGGIHVAGVVPLGGFAITFGPDIGGRYYSMPLEGYAPGTCHNKYGTPFPCQERASALEFYAQPRLGVLWNSATGQHQTFGGFVHLWVGSDLVPAPSLAAGVTLGLGFDQRALQW